MNRILFINASPNERGETARLAGLLLEGHDYDTLALTEYRIYGYGQHFEGDQFDEVIDRIRKANTIVVGSPLYWHNLTGHLRSFMDRCYGPVAPGEFRGKTMYGIVQGAAPTEWQLEACDFTLSRFASLYGLDYKGTITTAEQADQARF